MEDADRKKIISSMKEVVPRLNMVELFPKLLEHGIYMAEDQNIPKWRGHLTERETVGDIYLSIPSRGPKAFQGLLASLRETQQGDLADIIEGNVGTLPKIGCVKNFTNGENHENDKNKCFLEKAEETSNSTTEYENDSYWSNIHTATEPLKINLKVSEKFCDNPDGAGKINFYPMRGKLRGLVLIINNMTFGSKQLKRTGSEHDFANLTELFTQMRFDVTTHSDLTGKELQDAIEKFSKREELRHADSCFVIVMSHGDTIPNEGTVISGTDSKTLQTGEITDYFSSKNCPNMNGKPKVFIFQCCRGLLEQSTVPRNAIDGHVTQTAEMNLGTTNRQRIRTYSDTLVVFATLPGFVANRDLEVGSWYIQIFCEVVMNHARDTHLVDLLHLVDERLDKQRTYDEMCQTSTVVNMGFHKHCFLNPGL